MAPTKPIRAGFHSLTPHLVIRDCEKAIEFYERAFGAEEMLRMPGPDGALMHGELRIGDSMLMMTEENAAHGKESPQTLGGTPIMLALYVEDCDESYQRAVKAGAKPVLPPADMFWGDRYAQVRDPFGFSWAIATHQKDMSPAEMHQAAKKTFGASAS